MVGIWSYNAPAIVDVVREKNARDKLTVVAFDAEPKAVEEMGKSMDIGLLYSFILLHTHIITYYILYNNIACV